MFLPGVLGNGVSTGHFWGNQANPQFSFWKREREREREQDAFPKIAQVIQKADTAQEASCLLFIKSLHFCAKERNRLNALVDLHFTSPLRKAFQTVFKEP